MTRDEIIIPKRLKGEDGSKVLSIRVRDETIAELDRLAKSSNRSRNEIINLLLEKAVRIARID